MQKKKPAPVSVKAIPALPSLFPWDFRMKCYILLAIGFVFYANSILNKYALDDSIAIERNDYVQQGISGIGKILTKDSYDCFYRSMGVAANAQYSGGRYRPLSFVSFAIEQSLFGDSPLIRHLVNVLAYMAAILAIFHFLNNYLLKKTPGGSDVAFLATLLFAIHPIHTEVVANIKSLDEILSITLMMCTFMLTLKYAADKKPKNLVLALVCYFFSFLAKEYALTLVALLPLLLYFVANKKPLEAFTASLPFYGVVIVYILMRINAVGVPHSTPANDPLVDPFLYATHSQKLATECWALGRNICFLLFPYPLSCDYSYAQIPYHTFSEPSVWLSILMYIVIIGWAFMEFLKRSIIGFILLFYLACMSLVSNFVLELGAVLGERLLFHCSLAFVTILSYYLLRATKNIPMKTRRNLIMAGLGVIIFFCFIETVQRNAQWKDDDSLFIHDVNISTNSTLLNNDAGWCYLGLSESKDNKPEQARAYLDSSRKYLYRAIVVNKNYTASFINLASVYFHLGLPDSAKHYLDIVKMTYPGHPSLKRISRLVSQQYLSTGMALGGEKKADEAIAEFRKGLALSPDSPDLWYNLGGAFFTQAKWDSARKAWNCALQLKPDYTDAQRGLQAIPQSNTNNKPQ